MSPLPFASPFCFLVTGILIAFNNGGGLCAIGVYSGVLFIDRVRSNATPGTLSVLTYAKLYKYFTNILYLASSPENIIDPRVHASIL
jgi:hypothetical protein